MYLVRIFRIFINRIFENEHLISLQAEEALGGLCTIKC